MNDKKRLRPHLVVLTLKVGVWRTTSKVGRGCVRGGRRKKFVEGKGSRGRGQGGGGEVVQCVLAGPTHDIHGRKSH